MFGFTTNRKERKLLAAIDKTSWNLRTILKDDNIKLVLVSSKKDPIIKKDWKKQWDDYQHFDWESDSQHLRKSNNEAFTLALYSNNTLCGLCGYCFDETMLGARLLEIFMIEGKKTNNPLKGYVIAAFCQASLDISKKFKIWNMSIFEPERGTKPSYERLGYKKGTSTREKHVKKAWPWSKLNWESTFEHKKSKDRPAPNFL